MDQNYSDIPVRDLASGPQQRVKARDWYFPTAGEMPLPGSLPELSFSSQPEQSHPHAPLRLGDPVLYDSNTDEQYNANNYTSTTSPAEHK